MVDSPFARNLHGRDYLVLAVLLLGVIAIWVFPTPRSHASTDGNLLEDPSFEISKERDQFGLVFAKWTGWKYEGDCTFEVGRVARTGKTSGMMICPSAGKIRLKQDQDLPAGRYRITAYLRGLDISVGQYQQTTEFMFDGKYIQLKKNGTFGWTRLTYVAELTKPTKTGPSFGLIAPGMLWVDDVTLEKVGADVKLTEFPVLGSEEAPIAPPGPLGQGEVRCSRCRYRNMPQWEKCYACGESLHDSKPGEITSPPEKTITSFEDGNPFGGGSVVAEHATDGAKSLRIDGPFAAMDSRQDWSGYDFLKVDAYADVSQSLPLTIEIRDTATRDYWTRVNYQTVLPPGQSTLILPLKQLYVGEKARPGRPLLLNAITRLVFVPGEAAGARLFLDRLRLERDTESAGVYFEGLQAFDFGTGDSPVMDGFTPITPATLYTPGRGYGLKNAKIWRAVDALQPDPLYQDFLCIESGGLAVNVPNGKYRVFVNIDSPSGFWGEFQKYKRRAILAQGREVVVEKQDFKSFQKRYFQFWDRDDLPTENTFDKYSAAHFQEKTFDVEVKDGVLSVEFSGEDWSCSVSALILFPVSKAAEGERFLKYVHEKRRFYFDNSFKRVLHRATGGEFTPSAQDAQRGYVIFQRDFMKDVYYNDTPSAQETGKPVVADTFAGQEAPVAVAVVPLRGLGKGTLTAGALTGPHGTIPATAIDVGYVSYRLSRVTMDGAVYTIAPRYVMPRNSVDLPQGITRSFWLTIHTPASAEPGLYAGQLTFTPRDGPAASIPLQLTVRKGKLDPVDIPVGPYGGQIGTQWFADADTINFGATMTEKSLRALRARGFTMFSGVPAVPYDGFFGGKPTLDFHFADAQMKTIRNLGFLAVVSYGSQAGVTGLDAYHKDTGKMAAAGFQDYSAFIKAIYTAIQEHARKNAWVPVYWNIGDEPLGEELTRSIENAQAYRAAFPAGPPFFTAATSVESHDPKDPHFLLAKSLHVASMNLHNEPALKLLREQGGGWAFYNGGDRWTFGAYMYKAAKEFDMKFRISWHWNAVAGDPYYALDAREDDYCWANASPDGQLVPSLEFARITAGLDDYRSLLTLARLAKSKPGAAPAQAAESLIASRMAAFHLGDRDHDKLFGVDDWALFRQQVWNAIEALQ